MAFMRKFICYQHVKLLRRGNYPTEPNTNQSNKIYALKDYSIFFSFLILALFLQFVCIQIDVLVTKIEKKFICVFQPYYGSLQYFSFKFFRVRNLFYAAFRFRANDSHQNTTTKMEGAFIYVVCDSP